MQKETEKFVSDQEVLPYLLGDDSEEAQNRACWRAYGNNAGRAYRDFLDLGRGFLWGPLPMDLDGNPLDYEAFMTAVRAGESFQLPMLFSRDGDIRALPAELGEMIIASIKTYEPKGEVNLLFKRPDGRLGFFVGRFGRGGFLFATPQEFYEASQRGLSPEEFRIAITQKRQCEPQQ
jgi:hypothetical protein